MEVEDNVERDISSGELQLSEQIRDPVEYVTPFASSRTPAQSADEDETLLDDEWEDLPDDLKAQCFSRSRQYEKLPDYYAQPTFYNAILHTHQRLRRTRRLQAEISQSMQNNLPRVETALTRIAEEREELAIQHAGWASGSCPFPTHFWHR